MSVLCSEVNGCSPQSLYISTAAPASAKLQTLLNFRPKSVSQITKRPWTDRHKIECSCCFVDVSKFRTSKRLGNNNCTRFCIDLLISLWFEPHSLVWNSIKLVVMRVHNKMSCLRRKPTKWHFLLKSLFRSFGFHISQKNTKQKTVRKNIYPKGSYGLSKVCHLTRL